MPLTDAEFLSSEAAGASSNARLGCGAGRFTDCVELAAGIAGLAGAPGLRRAVASLTALFRVVVDSAGISARGGAPALKRAFASLYGGGSVEHDQLPIDFSDCHASERRKQRKVHSDVLQWLFIDPAVVKYSSSKGLTIERIWIDGVLDLSRSEIKVPLAIRQSLIPDGINLASAKTRLLDFGGSHIGKIHGAREDQENGWAIYANGLVVDDIRSRAQGQPQRLFGS